MTQQELAAVPTPSTAGVLERAIGTWGKLDYEHWVDHCGSGQLACLDIDHSGNAFCRGKKRNLSTPVL